MSHHPHRETGKAAAAALKTLWETNQVMKTAGRYSIVSNSAIAHPPGEQGEAPLLARYTAVPAKGCPEGFELSATVDGPGLFSCLKDVKSAVAAVSWGPEGVTLELDEEAVAKKRPGEDADPKKRLAWKEPPSMVIDMPLDHEAAAADIAVFQRNSPCGITNLSVDLTGGVAEILSANAPVLRLSQGSFGVSEGFSSVGPNEVQIRLDRSMLLRLTEKSSLLATVYTLPDGARLLQLETEEPGFYIEQYFKFVA